MKLCVRQKTHSEQQITESKRTKSHTLDRVAAILAPSGMQLITRHLVNASTVRHQERSAVKVFLRCAHLRTHVPFHRHSNSVSIQSPVHFIYSSKQLAYSSIPIRAFFSSSSSISFRWFLSNWRTKHKEFTNNFSDVSNARVRCTYVRSQVNCWQRFVAYCSSRSDKRCVLHEY